VTGRGWAAGAFDRSGPRVDIRATSPHRTSLAPTPPDMRHLPRGITVAVVVAFALPAAAGAQITFDPLVGDHGSTYAGHAENGFVVTPTTGSWLEAHVNGNPAPALYAIPSIESGPWGLAVARADGGAFTFGSMDATSYSSPGTSFLFTGYLQGAPVFSHTFVVAFLNEWVTYLSPTSAQIDLLTISASSIPGVSSFNVDNIGVAAVQTVPEPATIALFGTGLAGVAALARRRRRERT